MTYSKPKLIPVEEALVAIGGLKGVPICFECEIEMSDGAAYIVDE